MKNWKPKDLEGQFIDDLDPYEGDQRIPVPECLESDTAEAWQDFQDSVQLFHAPPDAGKGG